MAILNRAAPWLSGGLAVLFWVVFLVQLWLRLHGLRNFEEAIFLRDHDLPARWWAYGTAIIAHRDVLHVAQNIVGILAFGPIIERAYGRLVFISLFLGGGIVGGLVAATVDPTLTSWGASGGITALLGATWPQVAQSRPGIFLAHGKRRPLYWIAIYALIGLCLAATMVGLLPSYPRSGDVAHFVGFTLGYVLSLALAWKKPLVGTARGASQ